MLPMSDNKYEAAPGGDGRGREWGTLTMPVAYRVEEYMTPFNDGASRQQVFQRILRQVQGGAEMEEDPVYDPDWQYA